MSGGVKGRDRVFPLPFLEQGQGEKLDERELSHAAGSKPTA